MAQRVIVLALCALCSCGALAASQPPSPTPAKASQHQQAQSSSAQQRASDDKRGTENYPTVVKILPPEKTKAEADQERNDRDEKSANDRELVRFTGYLVVATCVLAAIGILQLFTFGLQARRLRQSVEDNIRVQRPYIVPGEIRDMMSMQYNRDRPPNPPNVSYLLFNVGKSHAVIEAYRHTLYLGSSLPHRPHYADAATVFYARTPVREDEPYPQQGNGALGGEFLRCPYLGEFTVDTYKSIQEGRAHLFFYGWVVYTDNFGFMHRKKYGFKRARGTWVVCGGEAYNHEETRRRGGKLRGRKAEWPSE